MPAKNGRAVNKKPEKTAEVIADSEKDQDVLVDPVAPNDKPGVAAVDVKPARPRALSRFFAWIKHHKKIVALGVVLLVVLFAIPTTRYTLAGLVIKKDVELQLTDASTYTPITNTVVAIDGKTGQTNNQGKVTLRVRPGKRAITVQKKYYKAYTKTVLVTLAKRSSFAITLQATGRQVPIVIRHKITGKPVDHVLVKALDTSGTTDSSGKLTLVLPADKTNVEATLTLDGYNKSTALLKVTEQVVPENNLTITPQGKVYFLSKQSGKIDVIKTNLDGSERQVALAGTGNEEDTQTVLLASRDWKYLALRSRRDGGEYAKLFLLETATGKLTTIDEGEAYFNPSGWSDHRLVYTIDRAKVESWQPKRQALKSYDADNKKAVLLDETSAEGTSYNDYVRSELSWVYLVDEKVIYTKRWWGTSNWWGPQRLDGKKTTIEVVKNDGTQRQLLKEYESKAVNYINASLYKPREIYFAVYPQSSNKPEFLEYEDGKIANANDITIDTFNKFYPTYLQSPSGKQTFWYEPRDGRNILFVGDSDGEGQTQAADLREHVPYGWYTDDYLLVSKKGSELFVMPKGKNVEANLLKISDYHKPAVDFRGYGGGYGGF